MAGVHSHEADREAVVLVGDPQTYLAQSDCGGFKMGMTVKPETRKSGVKL